ncbi:MAG: hypothetical protein ACFFCS_04345 [Candidatus Hodarchaeota archaeon]
MERQRKLQIVLILSMFSTGFFFFVQPTSASIETKPTVQPGDFWRYETRISTNDSLDFVVKTDGNFSIWFLNATDYASFILNNVTPGVPPTFKTLDGELDQYSSVPDVHVISTKLSAKILNASPYYLPLNVTDASKPDELGIFLYIVVQNHDSIERRILIQLDPAPYFLSHLVGFTKLSTIAVQTILMIWLFFSIKEAKRDKEERLIKSYVAWSWAFTFALASKLVMEAAHYYDRDVGFYLYPQDRLQGVFVSIIFPSAVNTAVPTVIFMMALAGAIVGYLYVVEKVLKNKKPILTLNLLIAAGVMPLALVLPESPAIGPFTWADILVIYWMISGIIGLVLIISTYINVAVKAKGKWKKKAIFTMFGIILPIAFTLLEHFDYMPGIPPKYFIRQIISQSIVLLGFFLFYKAMKRD